MVSYKLTVNIRFIRFVLLTLEIVHVQSAFRHDVTPSCKATDEECTFDFHINYIMSMVAYNRTSLQGFPVYSNNGTLFKRTALPEGNPSHCCENTPLSKKEMEEVLTIDGNYKFMYAINNQFPGPTIVVYENQKVKIRVYNDMANEAVTFHWHGMFQSKTPWMDGTSMISQCPILPGQMFTYKFTASPTGTHWYHSHHGAMRREGLNGAFIVLPQIKKERTDIPKVDNDVLFMTQDWVYKKSDAQAVAEQNWYMLQFSNNLNTADCLTSKFTYDSSLSTLARPYTNALINGKSKSFSNSSTENQKTVPLEMFTVKTNSSNRFRIINTGITGEYKISFDEHRMLLIATDGFDISPVWIDYLFINPGETYDVIVIANNTPGNFWIRVESDEVLDAQKNRIKPNASFAQLHYQEARSDFPESKNRECSSSDPCVMANCHWGSKTMSKWNPHAQCMSVADLEAPSHTNVESPKAFQELANEFQEFFLNFHFSGSDQRLERAAVNTIHFKNPPEALQVNPETVDDQDVVCNNTNMDQCGEYCQCTHVIKVATKKVTHIVLLADDGLTKGTSHPVHLHGNRFYVLKYSTGEINETTGFTEGQNPDIQYSPDFRSAQWRNSSWKYGNVPGINIENPPQKDTVMVPFKGYVVIRLLADSPGFWLMHCHLETHMDIGMAVVLQVGEISEQPIIPKDFPKCSNFKGTKSPDKSSPAQKYQNFVQLSNVKATTQVSKAGGSDSYEMSPSSYVTTIVFLVAFFCGIVVLSSILVFKQYVRRRGYRKIDRKDKVLFGNKH